MYDDIAGSYNELHGAEQERKLRVLLARTPLLAQGRVLDVGCATAHLSSYFPDHEYVGVDPSQALLDRAPPGANVLCARGEDLPFPDRSFDIALSLTALHNYDDPMLGVAELVRVCSGWLLVGVLRCSPQHDAIVDALLSASTLHARVRDPHDTLLVLRAERKG